jgi:FecR protein
MRRELFLPLVLILLLPMTASAQQLQAVVKEFSGKVEVKQPGRDWQPVQRSMIVSPGATVATGFASWLVLELGRTEIAVQPLTRMLLREIVKRGSTNVAGLSLRVGRVNATVKAAPGERNDFTIRGPAATAAVRGTELSFDVNVDDHVEGLGGYFFLVSNTTGQQMSVGPGMFGDIADNGRLIFSDQIISQHSSSGWTPSDLLWWANQHEGGFTLSTYSNSLIAPNVPPAGIQLATVTVRVN